MDWLVLLAAGAFAGTTAGLLGIGGGIIIVPVLSLVFKAQGVNSEIIIKVAVGTSLATIAITAISSTWAHHKRGAVRWSLVRIMTPGVIAGAIVGAWLADLIPGYWLTLGFVIFLILVSIQMVLGSVSSDRRLPKSGVLRGVASVVGCISALMGIGGGVLHVPYLSWHGVSVKQAIATAAAMGIPMAFVSTLGFVVMGWNNADVPQNSLGYVNLPAFAGVVVASILLAPLGAHLAHWLPDRVIKSLFALFLLILSLHMAYEML
jgi:uncharacterized membrane protein YfcA